MIAMGGSEDGDRRDGGGRWLLIFNDLLILLLTFFVLVLSFSMMDPLKFREAAGSARKVFLRTGENPSGTRFEAFAVPTQDRDIEREKAKKGALQAAGESRMPGGLDDERMRMAESLRNLKGVTTETLPAGLTVRLEESLMFSPDSAEIRRSGHPSVSAVAAAARSSNALIRVEGRAGGATNGKGTKASPWTLSASRAVSGVTFLAGEVGVSPERLSAAVRADSETPVPLTDGGRETAGGKTALVLTFQQKE